MLVFKVNCLNSKVFKIFFLTVYHRFFMFYQLSILVCFTVPQYDLQIRT